MLKREELNPENEEAPLGSLEELYKKLVEVAYNPSIPIEFFDFIVVDESIPSKSVGLAHLGNLKEMPYLLRL